MKHHLAAPPLIPGQASNYPADYPVSGGTYVPVWGNLTLTKLFGYIAIGIGLARDDSRAVVLLKQSYAYYIDNQWGYDKSRFTGLTHAGAAYTSWREVPYTAAIAFMLKQSGGPDLTGGNYISNALAYFNYIEEPWDLTTISSWGDIYGPAQSYQGFSNYGAWMAMTVFPTLPYSAYYYNQNVSRPDWTVTGIKVNQGTEVGRAYMFVDPHHASTSYKSSPLQYVFMDTDYASCVALSASGGVAHGATCYPNIGVQGVISRSDWTLTGSTIQLQAGTAAFPDHMVSTWGSYHILRKDPLLAGNGSQGGNWNGQLENDNVVELGGGANWNSLGAAIYPSYAPITHWAGTDPTGDAAGRYAYWMVDLSRTYTPAMDVSRAERSCIHFKKAGHQDYLTCYDDIATTSGKQETDFFHYYIHSSTISPSGGKVTVGTNTVTLIRASSSLVSSFLPLVSNGIYTSLRGNDSNGNSAVVTVCASTTGSSCNTSATSGEWIAVHLPSTSTSAAMPTLTQPSCTGTGGNCTVVQIADSSYPKVAAFARQGVTLSGVSFTTTHSGTAQYLIAGMVPGNYSVSVNGATVVSSVTVNANDNTLYFESTAGLVQTRSLGQR
jgi:hypothetical protein